MIHLSYIKPEPLFSKPNLPQNSKVWDRELHFKKGEKYLIKAPSGGGKSTLVHIIFGLRTDYEGEVSISNQNLSDASSDIISNIRKNQLSIVFQDLKLIPDFTAFENIEITRSLSNYKSPKDVNRMIDLLGAREFINQNTATLSYGQRQRIAIIRALSKPFSFLLLDEPFSHLDDNNIKIACQLIKGELKEQNAGLILVSHDSPYYFEIDGELKLL